MNRITEKFYEYTMPELVNQLERLNRNLEKAIAIEEEPIKIKSVGEMNKEIRDGIENIINIRKDLT